MIDIALTVLKELGVAIPQRSTDIRSSSVVLPLALLILGAVSPLRGAGEEPGDPAVGQERLGALRAEVERLRSLASELLGKEKGVLGEIARLDADLRLKEATLREASERTSLATTEIDSRGRELARIESVQAERRRYLAFRLREMYKRGPGAALRRLLGGDEAQSFLGGLRYATYLSERDRDTLASFRRDAERLQQEQGALVADRERLAASETDARDAREALAGSRAERAPLPAAIQRTGARPRTLCGKSRRRRADPGVVERSAPRRPASGRREPGDPARLRGSLDWPVVGKVVAGFGRVVHPQFKTVVPHPGLDIEAPAGTDIRAVLGGRVAYSAWLRG